MPPAFLPPAASGPAHNKEKRDEFCIFVRNAAPASGGNGGNFSCDRRPGPGCDGAGPDFPQQALTQIQQKSDGANSLIALFSVPVVGVEPTRCHHQRILSPSRLPIPTHRRGTGSVYNTLWKKSRPLLQKKSAAVRHRKKEEKCQEQSRRKSSRQSCAYCTASNPAAGKTNLSRPCRSRKIVRITK